MKTVSLIYTYGLKNSGDMAINLGAFDLLLDLDCEIKAFSKSDESDKEFKITQTYINEYYPQIKLYGGPFKLNRDDSKITTIINHINGYLKTIGVNEDIKFIERLTSSQLVVFNGGNLFRSESITDYARLKALMYPLKKAQEKKIPYIILPHSASTINKRGSRLLDNNLVNAKRFFTREDMSYDYLGRKFTNLQMEKSIDLAFFIKNNDLAKKKFNDKYQSIFNTNSNKIAITLRTQVVGDLGELNTSTKNKILDAIRNTIKHYINMDDYQIMLIVQTRKDREVTEQIYNEYKSTDKIAIIEEYDTLVLKEIYRNCKLLIGMRLHSIILALSANTPAIGYFEKTWGFKNPGLMQKFDLPYKLVEDEVDNLIPESSLVIEETSKYKSRIKDIIEKEKSMIKTSLEHIMKANDGSNNINNLKREV
jgi:polysaccharide pyruvyl transferase WcaK-like protein